MSKQNTIEVELFFYQSLDTGRITVFQAEFDDVALWGVMIGSRTVTVDVPRATHEEVVIKAVDSLKIKQQKIRADAQVECNKVGEQISQLLAIEAPAKPE